jgi:hypothetical protein
MLMQNRRKGHHGSLKIVSVRHEKGFGSATVLVFIINGLIAVIISLLSYSVCQVQRLVWVVINMAPRENYITDGRQASVIPMRRRLRDRAPTANWPTDMVRYIAWRSDRVKHQPTAIAHACRCKGCIGREQGAWRICLHDIAHCVFLPASPSMAISQRGRNIRQLSSIIEQGIVKAGLAG